MPETDALTIFLAAPPGLEPVLKNEAEEHGFTVTAQVAGGVEIAGHWPDVWRANLVLRGTSRVLVRIAQMPVLHLAQLDKRARRLPWADVLQRGTPIRVDAVCKRSKIYHDRAAAQRIATAIQETAGAEVRPDAGVRIFARIENNLCTLSLDSSGELLHKRGYKQAVGKAPIRETLAALALRACGYRGHEPVLDPMCGSGTFVIEAAEMALGLAPGRHRSFAFEQFKGFDQSAWDALRADLLPRQTDLRFHGSDRDAGAIAISQDNAKRADVADITAFGQKPVSALERPDGPPGLVIVNPPYGDRIGDAQKLRALYAALGRVLTERFSGWRVGLITRDQALAKATALPFGPPGAPFPNGDLRVRLFQTGPLP